MDTNIETVIFSHLVDNREYGSKVIPFLKKDYFTTPVYQSIYELIDTHVTKHNTLPSKEALQIDLQNKTNLNEKVYEGCNELIATLNNDKSTDLNWLIENTENFCKERALHNALNEAIEIRQGDSKKPFNAIPSILQDALAVSFQTHIGHDYLEDAEARYDYFHNPVARVPSGVEYIDRITKGGFKKKTLNLLIGGTNVGKSLCLCHLAASNLARGKNVLYITMEMAEEEISNRIDANLLDVELDFLENLTKDTYMKKINRIRKQLNSKLIVHEYPNSSASVIHFQNLINELKLKKNFIPDIIYIDYLNICASSKVKSGGGLYEYNKSVAEELRALGSYNNVPIVSAIQFNRAGMNNSNPGMENSAESLGIPFTADLMVGIISNDTLESLGQYLFKQLKNRYGSKAKNKKWLVGVDYGKMRLYDLEPEAQKGMDDINSDEIPDEEDKPVMDSSDFGLKDKERSISNKFKKKRNFSGFN